MRSTYLGVGAAVLAFMTAIASCSSDETANPSGTTTPDGSADGTITPTDAPTGGDGTTTLPDLTNGPIDPDVAARAAVVLASCIAERGADNVLEEIYARVRNAKEGDYAALARCIDQRRNGCQAIVDCAGTVADLTGPCSQSCIGNVLEGCDDQLKVRTDCTRFGETCRTTMPDAGLTVYTCARPTALECTIDTPRRCSNDGRVVSCGGYFEREGPVCADYGLICNGQQCAGTESGCQSVFASGTEIVFEAKSCEGTKLVACAGGGITKLDCGLLVTGSTCQAGDAAASGVGASAYCGLGTACAPGFSPPGVCDGDSVTVCNGGRLDKVDCKALGFSRCVPYAKYAFCGPSLKEDALGAQDAGGG